MPDQGITALHPALTQAGIDQRVFDLYDEYCHGRLDQRGFLLQAAAVTAGGLAMAQALLPRYAQAQTVSFTDPRLVGRYVSYPSPGGTSGTVRGYLAQPSGPGPFPAVLVIHENRGLNPYIEDVARRFAVEGFLALAPDGLSPIGGYPGNDDDGRTMQARLDQAKLRTDMLNGALHVQAHALSSGKLGMTGLLLGRRHDEHPGGNPGRAAPCRGAVLWRRPGGCHGPGHQGPAADPLRRQRRAHQREVAGLRGGVEGGCRAARGARVRRHPARLPQQLDAPLQRGSGQARVGAHGGALPAASGLNHHPERRHA